MTDSMQARIAADVQKLKQAGKTRLVRIRKILQDAVVEAMAEFKQGSGEIRAIAKNTFPTLVDRLNKAAVWYATTATQAEAQQTTPLKQRQEGFEAKAGAAGMSVAQKERQIQQQVSHFLRSVTAKF